MESKAGIRREREAKTLGFICIHNGVQDGKCISWALDSVHIISGPKTMLIVDIGIMARSNSFSCKFLQDINH